MFIEVIIFPRKVLKRVKNFFQYRKKAHILCREMENTTVVSNFILDKIVPMERIEDKIFSESERILIFVMESLKVFFSSKEMLWGNDEVQNSWNAISYHKISRIKKELKEIKEMTKEFRFFQKETEEVIAYIEKREGKRNCT